MDMIAMTVLFAKAFGLYLIPVGIGLMVDPGRFRAWYQEILSEERRGLFGGVIALLIGSFIIASHNLWVMDWRLIITLIGWWGFLKGSALIVFPGFTKAFEPMINTSDTIYRASGLVWILVGVLLAYQGFFA